MIDKFYHDINLELFVKWLYGNQNQYDKNIICLLEDNKLYERKLSFYNDDLKGAIIIWPNGIIEEEIYDKNNNIIYYLHYKLENLAQGQKMFSEFYEVLTKYTQKPPLKIIICCSGGLSASYIVSKLNTLITLKHLNYKIIPLGYHQLIDNYQDYDAIYLAPQISYLEPQIMKMTNKNILLRCIPPCIYACHNFRGLLDLITEDNS